MNTTSRREFLKQAGALGACVCCFGTGSLLESCASTKSISVIVTDEMATIPLSSFGDQNFITIQTKKFDEPVFISKQENGNYIAVRMLCTHKGCTLKVPEDKPDKLVCPCHGSVFSTLGVALRKPAINPLQSFHVTIENKNVIIHFS